MESHGSPPAMVGTLPEESGQLALSPMDVEPSSENVRTFDAPVFSRLRSARCGSIAFGTNPLDHMSAQAADGGTCQSTSFSLASSGRRPLGRGCYTDRMTDSLAPLTKNRQSAHQNKPKSLHKIWGKLLLITNRKLRMCFPLVPKLVTSNDLERRNGSVVCVISPNSVSWGIT